ncbi:MAG: ferredoxin [Rhodocyclaceae bacterium]|nr:ferredoxin [Rhodocyclaceae bacterium]MDZ4213167.1 ferredoxin [Rhodocyclaceae bacterium]
MALEIVESCVNCWACEPLCPSKAIVEAKPHFLIVADKCTECLGDFADPQCATICPIEGAIVNELNEALNPAGSLTGIPPARWAQVQREISAR